MSAFAIFDASGKILRKGQCPAAEHAAQVGPGEFLYVGQVGHFDRIDPVTREVTPEFFQRPPPATINIPLPEYAQRRRAAYPTVEQQLEWIWKAMDANELPRVEPMYSKIKVVRERFPKVADAADDFGQTEDL
jgi:hypothetical protein